MATSMEADSEVLFKEKREGKGVKTETAVDNATLRFDFRASTPATSPLGRGAEHRGGDGEEQRRKRGLRRMGKPIRGVRHLGTMERITLVPVPNRGSTHVFHRTAGARKDGVR